MKPHFSPAREDVDRYLRLRDVREKLTLDIACDISDEATDFVQDALGFFQDDVLQYDGHHVRSVLADCCLHDWYENGATLVQRYAAAHPATPGTDRHYVLDALLHARYRVLKVVSLAPGAGGYCEDLLSDERLFLMDVAMSQNPVAGFWLAARTIPFGAYWVTTGTSLPVTSRDIVQNARRQFKERAGKTADMAVLSLAIVRACLETGAADLVVPHLTEEKPVSAHRPPEERRYCPAQKDLDRYLRLRAASYKLCNDIAGHIPTAAYYGVGEAIGILRGGTLVFDSQDMTSVLADCCLYDWYENGMNVVQGYAQTHSAPPGTDEQYLLNAYLGAKYRVLAVESVTPGFGIECHDILNNEDLFVMDTGLSLTAEEGCMIGTRTIPLGEYWMTGGAGLPMPSREAFGAAAKRIDSGPQSKAMQGPGRIPLTVVRACLESGAADRVAFQTIKPKRQEPRHITRRNRHRR